MKTSFFALLTGMLFMSAAAFGQTRYGFAYAYNRLTKILYITYPFNVGNYCNCRDKYAYNATIPTIRCIDRAFSQSLKTETGSNYSRFLKAMKTNDNGFYPNREDAYHSKAEANAAIRDVIAIYRYHNFAVYRIDL